MLFVALIKLCFMISIIMDVYTTNPGPIDASVLYDQEKHVSSAVWEGQVQLNITVTPLLHYFISS